MERLDIDKINVEPQTRTDRVREFILKLEPNEGYYLDQMTEEFDLSENTISRIARLMKASVKVRNGKVRKTVICHPDTAQKWNEHGQGKVK